MKLTTDHIHKWSNLVTGVFSAGIVLYGIFKFVNMGSENNTAIKALRSESESIRQELNEKLSIRLDSIESVTNRTEMVLKRNNVNLQRLDSKVGRLTNQFTLHLSKDSSVTKQDLRDIINELDEKKN